MDDDPLAKEIENTSAPPNKTFKYSFTDENKEQASDKSYNKIPDNLKNFKRKIAKRQTGLSASDIVIETPRSNVVEKRILTPMLAGNTSRFGTISARAELPLFPDVSLELFKRNCLLFSN